MIRKFLNRFSASPQNGTDTRLGAVLVMLCAVSVEVIDRAYERQRQNPDMRIGDILVEDGAISADELAEALRLQEQLRNGKPAVAMATISHRVLDRREPSRKPGSKLAPA